MNKIVWTITRDSVEWEMDWDQTLFPHKPPREAMFEAGPGLALLLINEVVFLNDYWWKRGSITGANADGKSLKIEDDPDAKWTKEESGYTAVSVNCSDVFAWGVADAENLPYSGIESLYRHYVKDQAWGPAVWCIKQRRQMPQKPVEDAIRMAGVWDMDEIAAEIAGKKED